MKTLIYAHRGAEDTCPPNTMSAMRRAIADGADGIEIDVRLTADNQIVIIHDANNKSVYSGDKVILESSYAELLEYTAKEQFGEQYAKERIPLLSELLPLIVESEMILNIEIKGNQKRKKGFEQLVHQTVLQYNAQDHVFYSSFDHQLLCELKGAFKEVRIAPLYSHHLAYIGEYAQRLGAVAVHPLYSLVDEQMVERLHALDIAVNVWTPNSDEDIKRMLQIGVDGIITSHNVKGQQLRDEHINNLTDDI